MIALISVGVIAWLLYMAERMVYSRLWNRKLSVKIEFENAEMFAGDDGELLEVIENRKHLPLPMLKVKFQTDRNLSFGDTKGSCVSDLFYRNDVFQVGGGEKITRRLTFTAKKRGYYKIMGIDLVSSDLFLYSQLVESRNEDDCFLYVYPKPYSDMDLMQSLQQINGEVLTRRHLMEDPFEYRGIREYQPYDDMRSVNWKATAKTGDLKVNQKNYTALQTIRIFFNVDDRGIMKKDDAVDMSLRIVAGIASFFISQGIRVAVYGNGLDIMTGEVMAVEAGAGEGQFDQILKGLARLDLNREVAPFRETFNEKLLTESKGTVTMFVAPNSYDDMLDMVEQYQNIGEDYYWFYPIWEKEEPEIPGWLTPHVRWVHVKEAQMK